jgi:hypothetical protein
MFRDEYQHILSVLLVLNSLYYINIKSMPSICNCVVLSIVSNKQTKQQSSKTKSTFVNSVLETVNVFIRGRYYGQYEHSECHDAKNMWMLCAVRCALRRPSLAVHIAAFLLQRVIRNEQGASLTFKANFNFCCVFSSNGRSSQSNLRGVRSSRGVGEQGTG